MENRATTPIDTRVRNTVSKRKTGKMKELVKKPITTALVGFVFGAIIGPVVVSFINLSFFEKERTRYEARVETTKALIADLEKIKMTAPSNSLFKECLETKDADIFETKYEDCYGELRQRQEEARSILNRNVASIKMFFDPMVSEEILETIEEMDYLLYEMEDNQYIMESWSVRECPDMVTAISFDKSASPESVRKLGPKGESCTLALQSRKNFMDRLEKGEVCTDCISALRTTEVPVETVDSIIIPGDSFNLKEYILSMNSNLYSSFLANADTLLGRLRAHIL
ncbi:MAG: hypothetical protein KBD47_02770 [Candidatus Pacebacteria bacterium]|nr:hypothetical protein [Candidatus Paceibacterota bacterium]